MKQSMIAFILSILLIYGCSSNSTKGSESTPTPTPQTIILLENKLDDGRIVRVKSYSIEKGEANDALVKEGVNIILNKMTDLYITQIKMNSTSPLVGTCIYTFRIEPNGSFRMIQEGHKTLVKEDFEPLKESFLVSAMAHDFKFPAPGSKLAVNIEFEFK